MINIITTLADTLQISGPSKVLNNTIKGLNLIDYPFVINRKLDSTKRVWIQSGWDALPYVRKTHAYFVVGPNVALYPSDIEQFDLRKAIYIQPGPTAVNFWNTLGFNQCPLRYWAAGIDTTLFTPSNTETRDIVLVYHKQRDIQELEIVTSTLATKGLKFAILPYGAYYEKEYLSFLSRARYVIWHGGNESQGIALQEAMSCNIPILVCDVTTIGQSQHSRTTYSEKVKNIAATSVPYFNKKCGIRITRIKDLNNAIDEMEAKLRIFTPREFILRNLSLEKQAKELVKFWEYWNLSLDAGREENASSNTKFTIPISDRIIKLISRVKEKVMRIK